jgi:hypothetical protein
MEAIFAHSQATGRYVVASGEPLGVNLADSQAAKIKRSDLNIASDQKSPTERGESSKATGQQPQSAVGGKRKRRNFIEDEMVLLTKMLLVLLGRLVLLMWIQTFT